MKTLLTTTALACLAIPGMALAQSDDSAAPASGGLAEIVVTAQKRAENLQTTPLAISAISSATLDKINAHSTQDLSAIAPNLTVLPTASTPVGATIAMRGIPNPGSETFGFDNANGLYIDGVYIARSATANMDVADIQRVEVLRGPQGTLFGRNTTGGAVSFVTRDPAENFRLVANAGIGNYGAWSTRLTVDPGSIGGVRTSFSYMHRQRGGVTDNLYTSSRHDPGSYRVDAARFAAMADLGSTGSIRYAFDWTHISGQPMASELIGVASGAFVPSVFPGISSTQQAPVAPFLNQVAFLDPRCAALAAPSLKYRDKVCMQESKDSKDTNFGHTLRIENDFGPFKIKSTTGYRSWKNRVTGSDMDGLGAFRSPLFTAASLLNGMPADVLAPLLGASAATATAGAAVPTTTTGLFATRNKRTDRQFSQEIEISRATDHYDAVIGGFYFREKGHEANPQLSGFVLDTNTLLTAARFGAAAAALQAANPARYRLAVTNGLLSYSSLAKSQAIYGQATFYPDGRDGRWSLTAGGRYTWDQKSLVRYQNGATPAAVPEVGHATFRKLTWNFMLGYKATPDVNLYARAARGYRSGGFNTGDIIPAGQTSFPSFNPETVDSYEVGVKSELFDRHLRLNIAGFYNVYNDLLVIQPVANDSGTFGTKATNAGKVAYTGLEAEFEAMLNSNWSLNGGIGYTDVKYKRFLYPNDAGKLVDISSIARPSYVAPVTGNLAVNFKTAVKDDINLFARLGFTYEGKKNSFNNTITTPFAYIKAPERKLLDAQIGLDSIPVGGGQAQIKLWMKNITNEHSLLRMIDFGRLGYATALYEEPRTFGADLTVSF